MTTQSPTQAAIDYGQLMQLAIFEVIKKALTIVGKEGAPRNPGVYISFNLCDPNVVISSHLKSTAGKELTLVLENWFEEIKVEDNGFWVTLNFQDTPERIYVPFSSILKFFDRATSFGIEANINPDKEKMPSNTRELDDSQDSDKVVGLDRFRKNKINSPSSDS